MMRRIILLLICLMQTLFLIAQKKDNTLIHYFLSKNLLTNDQVNQYKYLQQQLKKSALQSLAQIKDTTAKKRMREQFESESFDFSLLTEGDNDTLSVLGSCLIVSVKQSVRLQSIYFEGDTSINKKNVSVTYLNGLIEFLNQLRQQGFTTQKSFAKVSAAIYEKEILDSFFVIKKLKEERAKEVYFSAPKLLPFLNALKTSGILSENNYNYLKTKIANHTIEDIDTIFVKCEKTVVIYLNDYGDWPQNYMPSVHQKAASMMPELAFSDFRVKIDKEKSKYDTGFSYKTNCSFTNSGKTYLQENFYSPADYNKDGKPDNEWKLGDNFYAIFNKVLRDKQSAYRIHTVNARGDYRQRANGKICLIALQKSQFDELTNQGFSGYFDLSKENFNNGITSEKIQQAITTYKDAGLFNHLTQKQIDSSVNALRGKEINSYSDILSAFDNVVFEIDLEYGVDDGQYKHITNNIAAISHGNFKPTQIRDTYDYDKRKSFKYGFMLNGTSYETSLRQNDDWLDTKFWDLILKAVAEQDKKGKYYDIYPSDGMRIVYLTHKQYQLLMDNKLLEFSTNDIAE